MGVKKLMPFLWNTIGQQVRSMETGSSATGWMSLTCTKFPIPATMKCLPAILTPFLFRISHENRNINILEYLNEKKEYAGRVAAFGSGISSLPF
jgi:hypothetical protein